MGKDSKFARNKNANVFLILFSLDQVVIKFQMVLESFQNIVLGQKNLQLLDFLVSNLTVKKKKKNKYKSIRNKNKL